MRHWRISILASTFMAFAALAAAPPTTVNYQGVLRNAADKPLAGTYDMQFAFYDAAGGGTQIMTDQHAAVTFNAVTVAGGLFNVQLGGGTVADGTGAGTYTSLADVFRDYGAVYLEIKVGAETLAPRVKLQSAAYALNATNLNGRAASGYVDTSSARQIKAGTFRLQTADSANAVLDVVSDPGSPQAMWVQKGGNVCKLQDGSSGIDCTAPAYGVKGSGTTGGGYFAEASGNSAFYAGSSGYGAYGIGSFGGGYFTDTGGSTAYLAHSGNGVEGYGPTRGGWFKSTSNVSDAQLGTQTGYGVLATGTNAAGRFSNAAGGTGVALLGYSNLGISASGSDAGAFFSDSEDGSAAYIGSNGWGVYAYPSASAPQGAGFFSNWSTTAYAVLGTTYGSPYGGPYGIKAVVNSGGNTWPGDFVEAVTGLFTRIAFNNGTGTLSSIWGNGSKNFVQNHPYDATKTITYACLEGDEVGTYTRGTARLVGGEARIALGETFQWVTNPDVGLTAQLTPRGAAAQLYVVSLSATELVVRSASPDSNAAFDYAVHGLRLGFEDAAVVTDKTAEAKLPAVSAAQRELEKRPDLARFTPLSRFREMTQQAAIASPANDMARGLALRQAIGEYEPARDRQSVAGADPKSLSRRPAGPPVPAASVGSAAEAAQAGAPVQPDRAPVLPANLNLVEVAERVSAGDLVALDPAGADALRLARDAASPGVVGIVSGEIGASWTGTAPLALGGAIVSCHVDAGYGAIAPGDLLVASATPGHAMRAGDGPHEGRVIAKALQSWTAGIGTIRVVVMTR